MTVSETWCNDDVTSNVYPSRLNTFIYAPFKQDSHSSPTTSEQVLLEVLSTICPQIKVTWMVEEPLYCGEKQQEEKGMS